jgi:hypothetical protein
VARRIFESGEICTHSGQYDFDGYVDGRWTPRPLFLDELQVQLEIGQVFPRVLSVDKPCCWTLVEQQWETGILVDRPATRKTTSIRAARAIGERTSKT